MKIQKLLKLAVFTIEKNSPIILTGTAIAGVITTTVLGVKAGMKAKEVLDEAVLTKIEEDKDPYAEPMPIMDKVKLTWKLYIPVAAAAVSTIACIFGAQYVNGRRIAALSAAYALSEDKLKDYKDKVMEILGEHKEEEIQGATNQDLLDNHPLKDNEVYVAVGGDHLCFDPYSGRYFKSDANSIRAAVNNVNYDILNDGQASLNSLYTHLGLHGTSLGDDLGWWNSDNLLDLTLTTNLAEDESPCLVLNFRTEPKFDHYRRS